MSILKTIANSYYEKKYNTQSTNITNNIYVYNNSNVYQNLTNGISQIRVTDFPMSGMGGYENYNNNQLPSR